MHSFEEYSTFNLEGFYIRSVKQRASVWPRTASVLRCAEAWKDPRLKCQLRLRKHSVRADFFCSCSALVSTNKVPADNPNPVCVKKRKKKKVKLRAAAVIVHNLAFTTVIGKECWAVEGEQTSRCPNMYFSSIILFSVFSVPVCGSSASGTSEDATKPYKHSKGHPAARQVRTSPHRTQHVIKVFKLKSSELF